MNIYFGKNLKSFRLSKDLTQEKLADCIGVSFQAISKWERGEGYPDITILPVISTFFGVTIDDLLGVSRAEIEEKIVSLIEEYDNISDNELKKESLDKLIKTAPNDFRVLLRELSYLIHFCDHKQNLARINAIYDTIQQNCNIDRIRISATRHITYLYSALAKSNDGSFSFDDIENIIKDMPYMKDGQEFISACIYPVGHPNYYPNIQEAVEESFCLFDTSMSHYYLYDDKFSIDYKIEMLEKCIAIKNMIYDDGNYGEQWQSVIYGYGHLGHFYFNKGDYKKALQNLKISATLAKKFDGLDRITVMHSKLFEGREFDKHKLGSNYSAGARMKYLMTEKYPLSSEFKETDEFKSIIKMLES